jgi:hypothetical protein
MRGCPRGFCVDCLWIRQEWTAVVGKNDELLAILDRYCSISGIFKRPDGYCDMFEEK